MSRKYSRTIASGLLEIGAVKLEVDDPFEWASGWKSPIYCDNRMTLSHPALRKNICSAFISFTESLTEDIDCIAGVATGGIPYAALLAESLGLPMIYVRSKAKGHGRQNLVEGDLKEGWNCLVIEDLISTGGSSMKAVHGLRDAGAIANTVVSIFTYGFDQAKDLFTENNCNYSSLVDYNELSEEALQQKYISENQLNELQTWRKNPAQWRS